jgi:hypothetical protein
MAARYEWAVQAQTDLRRPARGGATRPYNTGVSGAPKAL